MSDAASDDKVALDPPELLSADVPEAALPGDEPPESELADPDAPVPALAEPELPELELPDAEPEALPLCA